MLLSDVLLVLTMLCNWQTNCYKHIMALLFGTRSHLLSRNEAALFGSNHSSAFAELFVNFRTVDDSVLQTGLLSSNNAYQTPTSRASRYTFQRPGKWACIAV